MGSDVIEATDTEHAPATTAARMRAVVQTGYGSVDVLRLARVPMPQIADNEVLVRVHAAGLDRGTWHLMTGLPYPLRLVFGLQRPRNRVPGLDLAGTVVKTGAAISRFSVGDEVFGIGRGSLAEFAAARENKLAHKPANTNFEQAAVVPVSGLTALQGLRDAGRVKPGQKVLITGASGGVGTFAVQLAKAFGAEVTGVCSTAKVDLVRSLGADHVIDYTQEDFVDGVHHYDLILDIAGNPDIKRLRRALTPDGTAVIVGGESGGKWTGGLERQLSAVVLSPFVRQRLVSFISKEQASDLERLSELIEAGKLTPCLDRAFPLTRVREAMGYLESGKARGKIAVSIESAVTSHRADQELTP